MKHLLSINDLSKADAISILDTAQELARVSDGPMKKLPTLRGRTIVNLFAEDSTFGSSHRSGENCFGIFLTWFA